MMQGFGRRKGVIVPARVFWSDWGEEGGVIQSGLIQSDGIHMLDARDAMEACGGLSGEDKAECFVVFGVDKNADVWYDTVNSLETMLHLETFPEEEGVHKGQERI